MSLQTPEAIRKLQRGLYAKAKAEPEVRFYLLYDKVYREDILAHAYRLAKSNGGSAGVDGVRFSDIEASGVEEWLAGLGKELREQTYVAKPVRRVMIPKTLWNAPRRASDGGRSGQSDGRTATANGNGSS